MITFLLIASLICFLFGLGIIISIGPHGTDGDLGLGMAASLSLIISVVLLIMAGIWWIATHFSYVGGAA